MFFITFLCSFNSVSLSGLGEGEKERQRRENKKEEELEMGERQGEKGSSCGFGVLVY